MQLPLSTKSAKKTVVLVHTNQNAQHHAPVDERREHNARCSTTSKTSLANMPLLRKTTSTRKLLLPPFLALPRRPPPLPPLDQLHPLPHHRGETGFLSRGEVPDGHERVKLGLQLVAEHLVRQLLLLPLLLLLLFLLLGGNGGSGGSGASGSDVRLRMCVYPHTVYLHQIGATEHLGVRLPASPPPWSPRQATVVGH